MDNAEQVPDWLATLDNPTEATPAMIDRALVEHAHALQALQEQTYDIVFFGIMEKLAEGCTLAAACRNSPHEIDPIKFRRWIRKDKQRKAQYEEAMALGAEELEDELIAIADALDNPLEDVNRSKLRIETRWRVMQIRNKTRYDQHSSANSAFSGGVNIVINGVTPRNTSVEDNNMVIDGEVIDG